MKILAPTAFVLTSLAIYWSMWPTTVQVIIVIALGLPLYIYYEAKQQQTNLKAQFKHAQWLLAYLLFMAVMSYAGSNGFGGKNFVPYPWDFVIIIAVSLLFYRWGIRSSLPQVDRHALKLNKQLAKEK
jgi:hypothetical protein